VSGCACGHHQVLARRLANSDFDAATSRAWPSLIELPMPEEARHRGDDARALEKNKTVALIA
jgi:hypothetical protein